MTNPTATTYPSDTAEDPASHRLRSLAHEAEALIEASARTGHQKFDAARDRLRDEVRHLRSRLTDLEAAAGVRVKQAAHRTDETVQAHPYAAMGAAAAVGLLVGWLLLRENAGTD